MVLVPTPVWLVALPLLAAFLTPLWVRLRLLFPLLLGLHALLLALAVSFLPTVRAAPIIETIVIAPPLGIHLQLDAASLLMVALFQLSAVLVAAFLWLGDVGAHLRPERLFVPFLLLIAGCNGLVMTGDLFNLYVFLEIAGVSAYALSALRQDRTGLEAGLKYLIIGAVAAVFFLFSVVLLYLQTGHLNMAAIARELGAVPTPMLVLIGCLMLVGLGIKAELVPLNFWVPDIYRGSDPVVASLLSGVVVKAFLFVLFQLLFLLLASPLAVQGWLMAMGAATMLVAETAALQQSDLRRMLAYSSLGQVGLVTMALAFGSETTTAGALFHMINHTLVKLLLFLLAALLIRRAASARLDDLQGISRTMPLAAGLFVLGALAVLGLPPLSGFISKLWILKGFADAQLVWPIALILLGALIEAGYYFRWIKVLHGEQKGEQKGEPSGRPTGRLVYLPLVALAGALLLLGTAPFLLEADLVNAATTFLDREAHIAAVLGARP